MIGLDTNVLIRYLTRDDEIQAKLAKKLIDNAIKNNEGIFLNNIVICELIWVLNRAYKYSKTQLITIMQDILSIKEFRFERLDVLWLALDDYANTNADYADILISKINSNIYQCKDTLTFDKVVGQSNNFKILKN